MLLTIWEPQVQIQSFQQSHLLVVAVVNMMVQLTLLLKMVVQVAVVLLLDLQ
jgi:hypothetical protein